MKILARKVHSSSDSRGEAATAFASVEPPRPRGSHLTPQELDEFHRRLVLSRRRLVADIVRLEGQALRQGYSPGGNETLAPSGQASNPGDDTWQQLLTLVAIDNKRSLLREIDQALDRMVKRRYGICVAHNEAISKSLLEEVPWAKYCTSCTSKGEWGTRL